MYCIFNHKKRFKKTVNNDNVSYFLIVDGEPKVFFNVSVPPKEDVVTAPNVALLFTFGGSKDGGGAAGAASPVVS